MSDRFFDSMKNMIKEHDEKLRSEFISEQIEAGNTFTEGFEYGYKRGMQEAMEKMMKERANA